MNFLNAGERPNRNCDSEKYQSRLDPREQGRGGDSGNDRSRMKLLDKMITQKF